MCQPKKSDLKCPKGKDLSVPNLSGLTGLKVEYDSCYRGKIEVWKDQEGNIVKQRIIR